jgi:hypothetical protein
MSVRGVAQHLVADEDVTAQVRRVEIREENGLFYLL